MGGARSGSASVSSAGETRQPDWATLIDAKKKEMNGDLTSSISSKSRNTEVEDAAPISGMFKNLGRVANQYLASQVSERELTQTPQKKILGNYVDISV